MDYFSLKKREGSLEATPENSREEEGYVSSNEVPTTAKALAKGRMKRAINNNQVMISTMRKMTMIATSDHMTKLCIHLHLHYNYLIIQNMGGCISS